MIKSAINIRSSRSQRARLSRRLSQPLVRGALLGMVAVLLLLGFIATVYGMAIGWFVISLAVIPAMIYEWWRGELLHLPIDTLSDTIDAVLDAEILGQLPDKPTAKDVATAVGRVQGGQFFGARFGVTAGLLQNIASDDPAALPLVWQKAIDIISEQKIKDGVTPGVTVLALLRSFDAYEDILAQLHLDDKDIVAGIAWQHHLRNLIAYHKIPKRTGGIARDWSFGYIPLLSRFGQNISEQIMRGGLLSVDLETHTQALDQLISTFSANGRQNVALVGAPGVGKTAIVHAFAERLLDARTSLPSTLKFRQVVMLDAAALIAAAPGRGQLEQLIMQILAEAYSAKNVIICLDNAELFFQEGVGSVDLTNVLQPILDAGRLRIILTMDEQRFLQIGQRSPMLLGVLNRISIAAATRQETIAVMQDQLIVLEFQRHVTYTYQSLHEAYRLSERYIHDLAMPGRALKLLESAAGYAQSGLVTAFSVQQAIEQTMNIKVGVATDSQERDRLLRLEELIHKRMINQTRAVKVVSDALRRARAGVRNQARPIGTFLFLGPTGVGKTELAKALADVYFNGEQRIIRLDMNEYVSSSDVLRLITDGADDPMSLTAQIMKQPFSVVLLDEIEKAHPQVLTMLLQLLDEGVLRDSRNREISFRDAIIIATSNAGAERIREYIERGYQLEQFEKQFVDELIKSNQFRPEFLNRFDEIVVFRPLTKSELVQVVDLIIAGINKTLEIQKISTVVDQDAKLLLVDSGYDPQLGARPMRRVVQRAVENLIAQAMLAGNLPPGSTVTIHKSDVEAILGSARQADEIAKTVI